MTPRICDRGWFHRRWPVAAILWSLTLCLAPESRAAQRCPENFAGMVAESALIVRAKVVSVVAREVKFSTQPPMIRTTVTFSILETPKGAPCNTLSLEFPGGTIDGQTFTFGGVPQFELWAEEFLFIDPHGSPSPLTGGDCGRVRVRPTADETIHYLARDNFMPLTKPDELAAPLEGAIWFPTPEQVTFSPSAFAAAIRAEVEHSTWTPPPEEIHRPSDLLQLPGRR